MPDEDLDAVESIIVPIILILYFFFLPTDPSRSPVLVDNHHGENIGVAMLCITVRYYRGRIRCRDSKTL
jgi:hypothetical protein